MGAVDKDFLGSIIPRLLAVLLGVAVNAAPAPLDTHEAERLVFLLRHAGLDYGNAVRDGRVVNAPEYDEVSALVEAARARYLELRGQSAGSTRS